jgi:hypothetical protein
MRRLLRQYPEPLHQTSSQSNSDPHQCQPHLQDLISPFHHLPLLELPESAPRRRRCHLRFRIGEKNQTHWAAATAEVEPTLKEVLNGPDGAECQTAIDYEIGQLEKLGVWRIVNPPPRTNIIPSHFVLATKCGADGEKLKLRARLVANGQRQQYGLDYIETFAPTTNMTTIRTVLTIATHRD